MSNVQRQIIPVTMTNYSPLVLGLNLYEKGQEADEKLDLWDVGKHEN